MPQHCGVSGEEIAFLGHGTTAVTNLIIERRGGENRAADDRWVSRYAQDWPADSTGPAFTAYLDDDGGGNQRAPLAVAPTAAGKLELTIVPGGAVIWAVWKSRN